MACWKRSTLPALVMLTVTMVPVVPVAAQEAACDPFASVEVPTHVGSDGTPFTFRYTPTTCHDDSYDEVRLWLGDASGDTQASRAWNGTAWVTSTRYIETPAAGADGDIWPGMQANVDASQADALLVVDTELTLWGQWRGPSGPSGARTLGEVTLLGDADVSAGWDPDGRLRVRDQDGRLIAAAPTGMDANGLPHPPGFGHIATPLVSSAGESASVQEGAILLQRLGPALSPASWDLIELHIIDPNITNLQGVRLHDGEGTLVLPPAPVPASRVVQLVGPGAADPPAPWTDGEALRMPWGTERGMPWTRPETNGPFALAKGGETVWIGYGDQVLDSLAYGKADDGPALHWSTEPVEATRIDGRLFVRATSDGALVDTNAASDWTHPRVYRQHQLDRAAGWFDAAGPVRAFVCPDRCWEEVKLRIDGATTSIDINLYDLTLTEAVESLAEAATRGVDVRLLLHGRPVGAGADHMDRIAWAVETLTAAGVEVRTDDKGRFDVNHAKYLVVDEEWTVVLSENAVATGWSPSGSGGNRGWGVAVHDPPLAAWMHALFASDFAHPADTHSATVAEFSKDPRPGFAPPYAPAEHRIDTLVVDGPVRVRPLVAPDHLGDPGASPLVAALTSARHEIWTQQLNLPLDWKRPGYFADSPLVSALRDSATHNVTVLGTLTDAFEDGDPDTDGNDRTAVHLSTLPHIDLRLGAAPGGGIIHNKGWLVDPVPGGRNLVVVGSANGNLASQTMNREVDLMIESAPVATYYREILADDHRHAAPLGTSLLDDPVRTAAEAPAVTAPSLALLAAALALCGRRRT